MAGWRRRRSRGEQARPPMPRRRGPVLIPPVITGCRLPRDQRAVNDRLGGGRCLAGRARSSRASARSRDRLRGRPRARSSPTPTAAGSSGAGGASPVSISSRLRSGRSGRSAIVSPCRWPSSRLPTVKRRDPKRPGPVSTPGQLATSSRMRSLTLTSYCRRQRSGAGGGASSSSPTASSARRMMLRRETWSFSLRLAMNGGGSAIAGDLDPHLLSLVGEDEELDPAVASAGLAADQAALLEPVDYSGDVRVVAEEVLGQVRPSAEGRRRASAGRSPAGGRGRTPAALVMKRCLLVTMSQCRRLQASLPGSVLPTSVASQWSGCRRTTYITCLQHGPLRRRVTGFSNDLVILPSPVAYGYGFLQA